MSEIIKEWKKIAVAYGAKLLFLPFHIFRIKQNRVMFTSLTGGKYMEYSCNPKYIYECLQRSNDGQYEVIWAFGEPENYRFLEQQSVRLVKHFTWKAFYFLLTSKVVITNGSYVPWVPFRKHQVVINTWHGGGAYKRLDFGSGRQQKLVDKRNALAGQNTTVFVTSSRAFSRYVIRGAFHFRGEILETGMPRNDRLVRQQSKEARAEVRKWCGLTEPVRILLYAPTYRNGGDYPKLDMKRVLACLEKETQESWAALVRFHRYENDGGGGKYSDDRIKDVADYPDMQELLGAADLLITDYSSSIWDYSFLERPCYLYVPDLDRYRECRGFYEDIDFWHFPYARDEETLFQLISKMKQIDWSGNMKMHHRDLDSCETGHAAESVVEYIEKVCKQ